MLSLFLLCIYIVHNIFGMHIHIMPNMNIISLIFVFHMFLVHVIFCFNSQILYNLKWMYNFIITAKLKVKDSES